MLINQVLIHNFRIYKGTNIINFKTEGEKNITIITGKNGFGKTTFLMSLVWCLYGKNTAEVDDFFSREISGKYEKYIRNCLNRASSREGDTKFHVSILFTDVQISNIPCKDIRITRSYDCNSNSPDKVEILVDGQSNELINEYGYDLFIRDYLIPIETAKFFFFDAEKIVSLAESNSIEDRKELSKAYSEVLGIKKYEDLKNHLQELQLRYKKESAKPEDREKLSELEHQCKVSETQIETKRRTMKDNDDKIATFRVEIEQYQDALIKAGHAITEDEKQEYRNKLLEMEKQFEETQIKLKDLIEKSPFAIAADILVSVKEQVEEELNYREIKFNDGLIENKIEDILNEIDTSRSEECSVPIQVKIQDFYNAKIRSLIRKHFYDGNANVTTEKIAELHEFSNSENNELNALLDNLKNSYKDMFKAISKEYSSLKREKESTERKLREAEAQGEDPLIASYREKKNKCEMQIQQLSEQNGSMKIEISNLGHTIENHKQTMGKLQKTIQTAETLREKDELSKELIQGIREMIITFKEDKKQVLERRILLGLSTLMHKDFVKSVEVQMIDEDIEIRLFNDKKEVIQKEGLSMGEKQLYATALLKALVEESLINFPVFVDSPMQKLDESHAENVILNFYPKVSQQVVIFPILNKELTFSEFEKLENFVSQCYLINNVNQDCSQFLTVDNNHLFETYNKLYKE